MMYRPLITTIRCATLFVRTTAGAVIIALLAMLSLPLSVSAAVVPFEEQSAEAQFSATVQQLEVLLTQAEDKLNANQDISAEQAQIDALRADLVVLDQAVMQNFTDIEADLQAKGLPAVILNRHAGAVATYQQERDTLLANLDALNQAPDVTTRKAKAKAAKDHLKAKKNKRSQQPFDPNNLPNRSLKADPNNTPRMTPAEYVQAGLISNPTVKLAALGDFTFDKLPGANDPAYLAATTEVTLSPAIQAKVAELNHDAVTIFHWVRNNVEWQPTWGAIQDADLTLSAQRGNAMDISSLLIALLRASGIPARYVHGTIEVPTTEFKNWAGGFEDAGAAADFAASGGIPIGNVVSGGQITKHQLEHIWVEAAIDYHPSRGAKNLAADNWVQMDASYKQYNHLQGLDAIAISGIDPDQLAQDFIASGTVNTAESWVTGFDPTILEAAQTQAQTALENYITNNLPNPTVGDVIGGRQTIIEAFPVLPSALPHHVITEGARYGQLPSSLQQKITFGFYTDIFGDISDPLTFPWAQLNNEQVTLSFSPATPDDEAALQSLLPSGQITDISQLPSSIPSYLVNVVPELRVNGQIVKTGSPLQLGEEITFRFDPTFVSQGTIPKQYNVIAGSYLSIAVIGGNVSPDRLTGLQTDLTTTKTILASGNPTQIGTLSREDLLGDMFQAGTLGYFAQYLALSHIAGLQQGAFHNLGAGLGSVGYEPNVDYFFGFPRAIEAGGVALNIPIVNITGTSAPDAVQKKDFTLQIGVLSSTLEHGVPEQMFDDADPNTPAPDAFSAVKALQKAAAQGQRIYQLTQASQSATLANIHHDPTTMDEITNALATGREVITHTDPVSVPGYSGAGYIILDPVTGEGAYKISGGGNGGDHREPIRDAMLQIFSLGKDLALALIDFLPLSLLDLFYSLYDNSNILLDACNGVSALASVLLVSALAIAGFAVGILFPIVYGLLFGILYAAILNQVIIAQTRVCRVY